MDARLVLEDVEPGGAERARSSAAARAASSTHAPRAVFTSTAPRRMVARRRGGDEVARLGRERAVERDGVALGEELVQRYVRRAERALHLRRKAPPLRIDDAHPKAAGAPRDRRADAPEPHDPENGAVHARPDEHRGRPAAELAGAHHAVALGDAPRGGEQQAEGEIGGGLGEDARRVREDDAACPASVDIDVVDADRDVADDAEARHAFEEGGVDAVGEERDQAVESGRHRARRRRRAPPSAPTTTSATAARRATASPGRGALT